MTAWINTSHKAIVCIRADMDSLFCFNHSFFLSSIIHHIPHVTLVCFTQMWCKHRQYVLLEASCSCFLCLSCYQTFSVFFSSSLLLSFSYMSNLDRISAPDYIPTEQDVLRVRFPTTGIHDYSFTIKTITLRCPMLVLRWLTWHRDECDTDTIHQSVGKEKKKTIDFRRGFVCSRLFGRNRITFLIASAQSSYREVRCRSVCFILNMCWYCLSVTPDGGIWQSLARKDQSSLKRNIVFSN